MGTVWQPSPIAIAHPTLFDPQEISLFEELILANPNATEHDASEFFAQHPKFLFLGSGAEVRREVVISGQTGKTTRRVDFFRRSFGEAFWDIIELKRPNKPSIIGTTEGHPRLSSAMHQAISQAEDYRDLIIADDSLRRRLWQLGIAVCRPQILVIVGQDVEEVSPETLATLYDRVRRGPIEARTYTEIYRFATEHCSRNKIVVVGTFGFDLSSIQPFGNFSRDSVVTERDGATVVSLGREFLSLDEQTATPLREALLKLADNSSSLVVVDCSNVDHMTSAALGSLITLNKRLREKQKRFALLGLRPTIQQVFAITRLDRILLTGNKLDDIIEGTNSGRTTP